MKNSRGELTTQQIVILIVLIVSFSVILFLLFRLNLGESTDKEICRNSVVLKSKSVLNSGALDCKTNYVCISGGEKCEGFNEDYAIDIDMTVSSNSTKTKEELIKDQIMEKIAQEMVDCWWMFGEGQIDYVGSSLIGDQSCAICAIIGFDKEIQVLFSGDKIDYDTLYNFLNKESKEDSQTYLNYIYDGESLTYFASQDFYVNKKGISYLKQEILFDKEYFILTGISSKFAWRGGNSIPITILETTEDNYKNIVSCTEFVTKL